MKVPNNHIESFLNSLPNNIMAVMLYGQDLGVIQDRLLIIKEKFLGQNYDRSSVIKLDYLLIKSDHSLLINELNNYSFGTVSKCIVISYPSPNIDIWFKKILSQVPKDIIVILIANELPPSSSLRKHFESEPYLLSIPNYHDNYLTSQKFIKQFSLNHKIHIEPEVIDHLYHKYQGNRLLIKNELNKILLHSFSNKVIKLQDVIKLISGYDEFDLERIWLTCILDRNYFNSHSIDTLIVQFQPIVLLRSFSTFLIKLYELKNLLSGGKTFLEASKLISSPIFFTYIKEYENLIPKIEKVRIISLLEKLTALEVETKEFNNNLSIISFFCIDLYRV